MTPQERAAELCFKLALLVDADTHMEVDQDAMKAITEALTATRRAALLECAKVARNRADLYKPKLGLWLNMVNYHRSQEADDLADTLDRLAQEG